MNLGFFVSTYAWVHGLSNMPLDTCMDILSICCYIQRIKYPIYLFIIIIIIYHSPFSFMLIFLVPL
jgi:hypothetical protein